MFQRKSSFSSRSQFDTLKTLGSGTFGSAQHVRLEDDFTEYVIKEVNLTKIGQRFGTGLVKASQTEHKRLEQFPHPNIVTVYGSFEERYDGEDPTKRGCRMYYLIMEYCKGGDLQTAIDSATVPFEEGLILSWTRQILGALKYLHDQQFVHRDIKPKNIFLTSNDRTTVKLGDFGLAQTVQSGPGGELFCTEVYTAPEYLHGHGYSTACDIWSLGVTLYQIANLRLPFYNREDTDRAKPAPFSSSYSVRFREFVEKMFLKDPDVRPSVKGLLRDPFVTGKAQELREQAAVQNVPSGGTSKLPRAQHDPMEKWKAKPFADQVSALQAAATNGDLQFVRDIYSLPLPYEKRLLFEQKDENGDGLLNLAASAGQLGLVQYLIDVIGLNVDSRGQRGLTPLLQACYNAGHLLVVKFFVEQTRANLSAECSDEGWKAIHFAASFSDPETVSYLLQKRPDWLEVKSGKHGRTPLLHAAQYGNMPVLKYLVRKKDANVKAVDDTRSTALHLAACYDQPEIVCYLLDWQPDLLEMQDNQGRTPLYWAGRCSSKKIDEIVKARRTVSKALCRFLQSYYSSENEKSKTVLN